MNLVEVLEIHAVSGPESGVVSVTVCSVEGLILSTHLNLGVVAAEVVVETCIDAVVGISAFSTTDIINTGRLEIATVCFDTLVFLRCLIHVTSDKLELVVDEVGGRHDYKAVEVAFVVLDAIIHCHHCHRRQR